MPFSIRGWNSWFPLPSVLAGNALTPFSCMASMASALARWATPGSMAGSESGALTASAALLSAQAASSETIGGSTMAAAAPLRRKLRRDSALVLGTALFTEPLSQWVEVEQRNQAQYDRGWVKGS